MGIDDDEVLKIGEMFKSDSSICKIAGYDIVTDDSGDDFSISPNLRSRFNYNAALN